MCWCIPVIPAAPREFKAILGHKYFRPAWTTPDVSQNKMQQKPYKPTYSAGEV